MKNRSFIRMSELVRPQLLEHARARRLMNLAFEEFQKRCYPDCPPNQLETMRITFFAGAGELYSIMMYGADTATDEPTAEDMQLMEGLASEIEDFYAKIVAGAAAAEAKGETKQ